MGWHSIPNYPRPLHALRSYWVSACIPSLIHWNCSLFPKRLSARRRYQEKWEGFRAAALKQRLCFPSPAVLLSFSAQRARGPPRDHGVLWVWLSPTESGPGSKGVLKLSHHPQQMTPYHPNPPAPSHIHAWTLLLPHFPSFLSALLLRMHLDTCLPGR